MFTFGSFLPDDFDFDDDHDDDDDDGDDIDDDYYFRDFSPSVLTSWSLSALNARSALCSSSSWA